MVAVTGANRRGLLSEQEEEREISADACCKRGIIKIL
jgi:hypothetical protein